MIYTVSDGRNEAIGKATFSVVMPVSAGTAPTAAPQIAGTLPLKRP